MPKATVTPPAPLLPSYASGLLEAGVDEAGRGCLAGPVVAAAVVLDDNNPIAGLQDSKLLSPEARERLAAQIVLKARAWAVAEADVAEIGRLNILHASLLAMRRAIQALGVRPQLLLIDGNRFATMDEYEHICCIKGDGRFQSIAAASILAKTHRDGLMRSLALQHPGYGWERNMAYPTPRHRAAIRLLGQTVHHRPGFKLLPED